MSDLKAIATRVLEAVPGAVYADSFFVPRGWAADTRADVVTITFKDRHDVSHTVHANTQYPHEIESALRHAVQTWQRENATEAN